ncbi:MAG: hypothetical protein IJZ22_01555 [Bacteroidaceae bacterium]|nr:hypothetical protein [Bacteroidaceae bacterium]
MDGYLFKDDIEIGEYSFGKSVIDNSVLSESLGHKSLISYKYIDLNKTPYNFKQYCFDNNDIVGYFEFMKKLSTIPFKDLRDGRERGWHLNETSYYQKNLNKWVNIVFDLKVNLKPECTPTFYHFAIYDKKVIASRASGIKAPRIYFFFGHDAIIYPLFYDPYHEINP